MLGKNEELPFQSGTFDLITANMVIEHLMDPGAVLHEVARVLRPGGRFMFVTPNLTSPYIRLAACTPDWMKKPLIRLFEGREDEDIFPTTHRMNTTASIRRYAGAAGFRVLRLEHLNSPALTGRFGPLAIPELLAIRLLQSGRLQGLRIGLLVVLEKPQPI